MATKAFKEQKVNTIKELLSKAKVAIVSDYRGLSVEEITDLRRRLQAEKGDFTVVKNTLTKIAVKETGFEKLEEFLQGPTAIAVGFEDEIAPARVLTKFIKEKKKTEIKGGILDGKILSPAEVREISNLPSKQELYAQILRCINAPAQGIVNTVNAVPKALVTAMEEIRKQKETNQSD